MADKPIIFSTPMVRALLEGRKTKTRRVLKDQHSPCRHGKLIVAQDDDGVYRPVKGPYAPGDRLWVRERGAISQSKMAFLHYVGNEPSFDAGRNGIAWPRSPDGTPYGNRPSIHMPRWASRLTLIVESVKVERLQDISEADAQAEGVEFESADPPFFYVPGIWPHSITAVGLEELGGRRAARSYSKLWNHINGPEAWAANPWVVAITFRVVKGNIDQVAAAICTEGTP